MNLKTIGFSFFVPFSFSSLSHHFRFLSLYLLFSFLFPTSFSFQVIDQGHYISTLGINYGVFPQGSLRFKAPLPFDEEILFNSSSSSNHDSETYKDNPLSLSLHVPKTDKDNFPVLVWLSSSSCTPEFFMSSQRIIFVCVNYRVGALGFFSDETLEFSGNNGLKDQRLALLWIQKNISKWRGNPGSVTLFGGLFPLLHCFLSSSLSLFTRVISQSSSLTYNSKLKQREETSSFLLESLLELTHCESLTCLQNIPEETFNNMTKGTFDSTPSQEKGFLSVSPNNLLAEEGLRPSVPLLMGGNRNNGESTLRAFLANEISLEIILEDFDIHGPRLLFDLEEESLTEEDISAAHILRLEYELEKNKSDSTESYKKLVDLTSDFLFLGPIDHDVRLLSQNTTVYYYRIDFDGGACSELEYICSFWTRDEMTNDLIEMWTSFAESGIPSENWSPVRNSSSPEIAILKPGSLTMARESDFEKRMNFISNLLSIHENYKNLDFESHPAFVKAMNERSTEDHEEL